MMFISPVRFTAVTTPTHTQRTVQFGEQASPADRKFVALTINNIPIEANGETLAQATIALVPTGSLNKVRNELNNAGLTDQNGNTESQLIFYRPGEKAPPIM